MSEIDRMMERARLEPVLKEFSKEEQTEIFNDITEFKKLAKTEVSFEVIALIIFYYKKNRTKYENSLS